MKNSLLEAKTKAISKESTKYNMNKDVSKIKMVVDFVPKDEVADKSFMRNDEPVTSDPAETLEQIHFNQGSQYVLKLLAIEQSLLKVPKRIPLNYNLNKDYSKTKMVKNNDVSDKNDKDENDFFEAIEQQRLAQGSKIINL